MGRPTTESCSSLVGLLNAWPWACTLYVDHRWGCHPTKISSPGQGGQHQERPYHTEQLSFISRETGSSWETSSICQDGTTLQGYVTCVESRKLMWGSAPCKLLGECLRIGSPLMPSLMSLQLNSAERSAPSGSFPPLMAVVYSLIGCTVQTKVSIMKAPPTLPSSTHIDVGHKIKFAHLKV